MIQPCAGLIWDVEPNW